MSVSHRNEEFVQALARPEAYSNAPSRVEVKETHISWVFLADELVFKVKKPVRFDFLDFSTADARHRACLDEVRLNRRLAPGVYLNVVPVTETPGGGFRFGGEGATVDWAVRMRRLPDDRMLSSVIERGDVRPEQIDQLVETLARFSASLSPEPIAAHEYRERYFRLVWDNRRELLAVSHHLSENTIKFIHAIQLQTLFLRADLFDRRVAAGLIKEGHGDLRPEHVCFTDPPVVFDCIEFEKSLRQLDVADDLAFLIEECDYLDSGWIGDRLIERYEQSTGDAPNELWSFYKSYRACVRAKVAAVRAEQLTGARRDQEIEAAVRHLALAGSYLRTWRMPLVIVVGGLSGTGKSTLAAELADRLGAEILRTDVIRRQLFETNEGEPASVDQGVYEPAARQRVYDELFATAARFHQQSLPVVLDGTFPSAALVRAARSIAKDSRSRFLAVECTCRPEVAIERINRRLAAAGDASDARADVYAVQRRQREAWPDDMPHCRVDTEQRLDQQLAAVAAAIGKR